MDRELLAQKILFLLDDKKEQKNSYEFGKAGCRHKIYYDDIKELEEKVVSLTEAGFIGNE